MEVINIREAERFETGEGTMRPLLFGGNLSVFHLEVPPRLEVPAHGHPGEGVLYCLEGEMEAISGRERTLIKGGTALLVKANEELGLRNPAERPARALLISSPGTVKSLEEFKELLKKFGPAK
jgi:quercetin dioxygenase-like cupin family protein